MLFNKLQSYIISLFYFPSLYFCLPHYTAQYSCKSFGSPTRDFLVAADAIAYVFALVTGSYVTSSSYCLDVTARDA